MNRSKLIVVGEGWVSLNQIVAVANGNAIIRISADERFMKLMRQTKAMLLGAIKSGVAVYGVNTGYGKSCGKQIPLKDSLKKTVKPIDFNGCGTGDPINVEEIRAAMFCRMLCLAKGYSVGRLNYLSSWLLSLIPVLHLLFPRKVPSEHRVIYTYVLYRSMP
ncbi:MAG: aromatic amino acid lyase [Syntrophales bacterium]